MKLHLKSLGFILMITVVAVTFSACTKQENPEQVIPAKKVSVQTIAHQDVITSGVTVSGTVVPKQFSSIKSLTQGTIEYVAPIGSDVYTGQPLFSIRDANVESNYFNSLRNLEETRSIVDQRVSQAELAFTSAEARHSLAEKSYLNTQKQTEQSMTVALSNAVSSYRTSYNVIEQAFSAVSSGDINADTVTYAFDNALTTDQQYRTNAVLKFNVAVLSFKRLKNTTDELNVERDLDLMQEILFEVKNMIDTTVILLQKTVASDGSSATELATNRAAVATQQTLINARLDIVINNLNGIRSTRISNGLILDQAKSQLDLSDIELHNAQISLESARNSAELERTRAQGQFDQAAYSFSNLTLPSPFTGVVLSHFVGEGEQVSPGQPLLEIGNLDLYEIKTSVDAEYAKTLTVGDKAVVNDSFDGTISEVEPAGNINSGKLGVVIQINNQEKDIALVAGEIADVHFDLQYDAPDSIVIPIKAATIESTGTTVLVVENDLVAKRTITLGRVYGDKVEVTSGLSDGDQVVLPNGTFVSVGDAVMIQES